MPWRGTGRMTADELGSLWSSSSPCRRLTMQLRNKTESNLWFPNPKEG